MSFVYNKKLNKIVKIGRVFYFRWIDCKNLGDFYNKGWKFTNNYEEAVKELGDK